LPGIAEGVVPLKDIADSGIINTSVLLDSLYKEITCDKRNISGNAILFLRKLLTKFEVTKRIYEDYDTDFKPLDKDACRNLSLYLRAAEIFDVAYMHWGSLQYLNALLKIMDILCAFYQKLNEAEQARLVRLIECEQEYVTALAKTIGVTL
jgi:hypothetical protein